MVNPTQTSKHQNKTKRRFTTIWIKRNRKFISKERDIRKL